MGLFPPHPDRRPAIVTGASSGIGEHTARLLGSLGFPVVLGARQADKCAAIAAEIVAAGGEAHALILDLANADSVDSFCASARDCVGDIEVVISNAAVVWPSTAVGTDATAFEDLLRTNLIGPHRLVSAFVVGMIERQRGDVVFVTSDIVQFPRPGMAAYAASKNGLDAYARILQMELEGTGVRASVVRPGPTRTSMGTTWDPEITAWVLNAWAAWGHLRHGVLLRPQSVASSIVSAVTAERGTHLMTIDVQPEGLITQGEQPV